MKKNNFSTQVDLSKFTLVSEEEKAQIVQMRESTTFWKDGFKRLSKNKIAMTCITIIILIILIAIFVPMFWPYSYDQMLGIKQGVGVDASYNNLLPFQFGETEKQLIAQGQKIMPHLFGTDDQGRDYFIRVIYGTRISLFVGVFASTVVLVIGLFYGSVSGYFGGKVDLIMMRIVDIIYSLPDMLIIILLSVVFKQVLTPIIKGTFLAKLGVGMISIFIVFALLYWVSMARLIRGEILSLKQQEYILAAKSMGAKPSHIIRRHLLPNCMSVIIISTCLQVPSAIFTESFLSFLGLGVSIPMPSLGSLASAALDAIYSYPYRLIIPAIMIWLIVLSFNLFGDGLRDAFDPKLRK